MLLYTCLAEKVNTLPTIVWCSMCTVGSSCHKPGRRRQYHSTGATQVFWCRFRSWASTVGSQGNKHFALFIRSPFWSKRQKAVHKIRIQPETPWFWQYQQHHEGGNMPGAVSKAKVERWTVMTHILLARPQCLEFTLVQKPRWIDASSWASAPSSSYGFHQSNIIKLWQVLFQEHLRNQCAQKSDREGWNLFLGMSGHGGSYASGSTACAILVFRLNDMMKQINPQKNQGEPKCGKCVESQWWSQYLWPALWDHGKNRLSKASTCLRSWKCCSHPSCPDCPWLMKTNITYHWQHLRTQNHLSQNGTSPLCGSDRYGR